MEWISQNWVWVLFAVVMIAKNYGEMTLLTLNEDD